MPVFLDLTNELQKEYISTKSTGNVNLALGFNIPLLLESRVARIWNMEKMAVTYRNKSDMATSVIRFIQNSEMRDTYKNIIKKTNAEFQLCSINNLSRACKKG